MEAFLDYLVDSVLCFKLIEYMIRFQVQTAHITSGQVRIQEVAMNNKQVAEQFFLLFILFSVIAFVRGRWKILRTPARIVIGFLSAVFSLGLFIYYAGPQRAGLIQALFITNFIVFFILFLFFLTLGRRWLTMDIFGNAPRMAGVLLINIAPVMAISVAVMELVKSGVSQTLFVIIDLVLLALVAGMIALANFLHLDRIAIYGSIILNIVGLVAATYVASGRYYIEGAFGLCSLALGLVLVSRILPLALRFVLSFLWRGRKEDAW